MDGRGDPGRGPEAGGLARHPFRDRARHGGGGGWGGGAGWAGGEAKSEGGGGAEGEAGCGRFGGAGGGRAGGGDGSGVLWARQVGG